MHPKHIGLNHTPYDEISTIGARVYIFGIQLFSSLQNIFILKFPNAHNTLYGRVSALLTSNLQSSLTCT